MKASRIGIFAALAAAGLVGCGSDEGGGWGTEDSAVPVDSTVDSAPGDTNKDTGVGDVADSKVDSTIDSGTETPVDSGTVDTTDTADSGPTVDIQILSV